MKYTIKKTTTNAVVLSENRKNISVDFTIDAEGAEGKVAIPINIGNTIKDIPLSLGEELPDYLDEKIAEWFNENYPNK